MPRAQRSSGPGASPTCRGGSPCTSAARPSRTGHETARLAASNRCSLSRSPSAHRALRSSATRSTRRARSMRPMIRLA
eukprot:3359265-Pyramimonas_sp.AAC.1